MGAAPGQFFSRGFLKVVAIGAVVLLVLTAVLFRDSTLQLHSVWESSEPCTPPGSGRLSPKRIKSTALISFPGSGNTWTRHLLTTVTGLLTGSQYSIEEDIPVDNKARARRLLVVKTHAEPDGARRYFSVDRGILLIRNPYDATLAEFNRETDPKPPHFGHTLIRSPEDFRTKWPPFVSLMMERWQDLHLAWAEDIAPLHVLVYHRLVADPEAELRHIFHFLQEPSITPNIHCATLGKEGVAHRKKPDWQKEAAVFNKTQRQFLNNAIDRVQKALHRKTRAEFGDFQTWKR